MNEILVVQQLRVQRLGVEEKLSEAPRLFDEHLWCLDCCF